MSMRRRGTRRAAGFGWRRHSKPRGLAERIATVTVGSDYAQAPPGFGSGVIAPGTSRYQRLSAHLPSGVTRFQGIGVVPADVAVDLSSDEPALDLRT